MGKRVCSSAPGRASPRENEPVLAGSGRAGAMGKGLVPARPGWAGENIGCNGKSWWVYPVAQILALRVEQARGKMSLSWQARGGRVQWFGGRQSWRTIFSSEL
jgi:hypothetical protein